MRLKLLKLTTILLLAGSSEARPQKIAPLEASRPEVYGNGWKPVQMRSEGGSHTVLSNNRLQTSDSQRKLKDLQYMDQSLRTVATQLLNVSSSGDVTKKEEKQEGNGVLNKLIFVDTKTKNFEDNHDTSTIVEVMDPLNFDHNSTKSVPYERPVNSKFGYIESSHPGQAMALTEEELEKEFSMIKHPTAHKIKPTTTSGISTWILLNPPSTTPNFSLEEERTKYPFTTEGQTVMKTTSSNKKVESNDQKPLTGTIEKVTTPPPAVSFEKINTQVPKKSTPMLIRKSTTPATQKQEKQTAKPERQTAKPEKFTKQTEKPAPAPEKSTLSEKKGERLTQSTTPKSTTPMSATSVETKESDSTTNIPPKPVSTTKKVQPVATQKPKTTSQSPDNNKGSATVKGSPTKASKPNPPNRPKFAPQKKTTPKPEIQNLENPATSKIEKVTYNPDHMITTQTSQLEETEVPMFITKIKASLFSETKKTTPAASPTVGTTKATPTKPTPAKANPYKEDRIEVPIKAKPTVSKANNVLKAHLKKPVNDLTKIEIEPIKVNPPILIIEKVEDEVKKEKAQDSKNVQDLLDNSKIDLKFDFNPELTKIDVETTSDKTPTTTAKSASKRRQTNKRKKNKNRKRKPSTTASPSESTNSEMSALSTIAELFNISDSNSTDNTIQESKIEPETKVANSTKNKKKQVQKPISAQIYNFLSREVMPSFGVMSLVGLGLGLASYFLYPFSGAIARRNYELEPNYKYNLDEYGGNYGQSEEEVFSKVLQGMTKHDNKFGGIKDYEKNYYKYQHFDEPYSTTTKKNELKHLTSSGPIYRPLENSYDVNYRNSEFKYPDVPPTPNYYERQKQPDSSAGKEVNGNRQFVVGNLPKEYSLNEKLPSLTAANKRVGLQDPEEPTKFEREMAQNFNFPKNSVNIPQAYAQVESQTAKNEDVYEEIEITPSAVAVEHGPRLLRIRRSDSGKAKRLKRESVIQVIPSKSELEKEHREEEIPLSNDILDIIDSAIPGVEEVKTKERIKQEDLNMQKKKQEEDKKTKAKEKIVEPESITKNVVLSSSAETVTPSSTFSTVTSNSLPAVSSKTVPSKVSSKIDFSKTEAAWSSSTTGSNLETSTETSTDRFTSSTSENPKQTEAEGNNIFGVMRKIAEIKIKLALSLLKHASEGFARYLGHVQKRINGEA
ncbi:uncharacterized protein LOC117167092 [Belonocnema kinseyi]|uniref:uncharacterized protein LOC117167092 n=1 Tax=Belonocnema kinseyi TaxID=2817044 RepID=UPI00143D1E68|nr:uncharacterized protein LOC117167092 [Belonocnema kinseyi]XP_033207620.1 uncharacterized protein LOC117167092 [Belonocnema kinseyi]XP_033207621.1 uncharacterized protein LOC117167092 [Belonocnema kinseyi]XP_033207622.1 uncharacterized protein LOC117167092 [Belonocnema kinseyi]XP_033207623.1 uncharacterized protein LOC117167092 [Belonocnema kinseyi]